jgi:CIC family chloride channel protein
MVIGGLLGTAFWRLTEGWLPGMPASPAPLAIVGMMALFGGIAHAPLAVMLMVAEMTGNLSLLAPAMIALGLATLIVGDETIYTAQLATRADSPAHRYRFSFPLLSTLPVRAAITPPPAVLRDDVTVAAAEQALVPQATPAEGAAGRRGGAGIQGAPVLDARGVCRGVITLADLARVPAEARAQTPLGRIVPAEPATAAPNETLDVALERMARRERSWLPVVEPGTGQLLGVLTVAHALQQYRAAVQRGVRRIGGLVEGTSLVEVRVEPGASLAWQKLATAGLPPGAVVMALRRHGEVIVPRGDTALHPGDTLTLVVTPAAEAPLQEWLAAHAVASARRPRPAIGASDRMVEQRRSRRMQWRLDATQSNRRRESAFPRVGSARRPRRGRSLPDRRAAPGDARLRPSRSGERAPRGGRLAGTACGTGR